jgi:2-polyprenyl-6-methoxyphenol hydroxylase-like FAD-dependent oxidoreductase
MTDGSTAETVTIIGAGIGGLYLVAELGIAGFKLRLHDIGTIRGFLKFKRAAGWMLKAREAGSRPSNARRLIFPQLSMALV